MTTPATPVGKCQFCKCTADAPCVDYAGNECGWVTKAQDLCTNGQCIKAADLKRKAELARKRAERTAAHPWKVIQRNAQGRAIRIVRKDKRGRQR